MAPSELIAYPILHQEKKQIPEDLFVPEVMVFQVVPPFVVLIILPLAPTAYPKFALIKQTEVSSTEEPDD